MFYKEHACLAAGCSLSNHVGLKQIATLVKAWHYKMKAKGFSLAVFADS